MVGPASIRSCHSRLLFLFSNRREIALGGAGTMALWALGIVLSAAAVGGVEAGVAAGRGPPSCGFPALFSFGDNNSDIGQHQAMFADLDLPNGQTFFGKYSGRFCDGRLIIDFIAEHLGFPYLGAYFDTYNRNYRHGASFALGGSSLDVAKGWSSFSLDRQFFLFNHFKSLTLHRFNNHTADGVKNDTALNLLPRPEEFPKALYIIDIGQNDFAFDLLNSKAAEAQKSILARLESFEYSIQALHHWYAANVIMVLNVGPLGCLPYHAKTYLKNNPGSAVDQNGCSKDQNDLIQEFNKQLKARIQKLRGLNPNAALTYVDVYSAKYNLICNARKLGFNDPMKFCCGSYDDRYIPCGRKGFKAESCSDPSKYISWDGIHYTEAANRFVAKQIINGSLSDPPLPLAEACRKP